MKLEGVWVPALRTHETGELGRRLLVGGKWCGACRWCEGGGAALVVGGVKGRRCEGERGEKNNNLLAPSPDFGQHGLRAEF